MRAAMMVWAGAGLLAGLGIFAALYVAPEARLFFMGVGSAVLLSGWFFVLRWIYR